MAEKVEDAKINEQLAIAISEEENEVKIARFVEVFEKAKEKGNPQEIIKVGEIFLKTINNAIEETVIEAKTYLKIAEEDLTKLRYGERKTPKKPKKMLDNISDAVDRTMDSLRYLSYLIRLRREVETNVEEAKRDLQKNKEFSNSIREK